MYLDAYLSPFQFHLRELKEKQQQLTQSLRRPSPSIPLSKEPIQSKTKRKLRVLLGNGTMDDATRRQFIVEHGLRDELADDGNWTNYLTKIIIDHCPSQRARQRAAFIDFYSSVRYFGKALLRYHDGKFNLNLKVNGTGSYKYWEKIRVHGSEGDYYVGSRRTISTEFDGTWTISDDGKCVVIKGTKSHSDGYYMEGKKVTYNEEMSIPISITRKFRFLILCLWWLVSLNRLLVIKQIEERVVQGVEFKDIKVLKTTICLCPLVVAQGSDCGSTLCLMTLIARNRRWYPIHRYIDPSIMMQNPFCLLLRSNLAYSSVHKRCKCTMQLAT